MAFPARALVVTANGGPDVLKVLDVDVPSPGPGEVLVRVADAGVNFIDVYQRRGVYSIPTPFVSCSEGAGEVIAIGADVTDIDLGDRVAWADVLGSAAGIATVPADELVPVPESVALDVAAAAMLQGMTAHYLVTSTFSIKPGNTALVHAAAGGVGQLLVQMIKSRGGRVIATAGSDAKLEIAAALGADETLNYTTVEDLASEVRARTGGRGVDVVYDGVGAATFDASLDSLCIRGTMVLYGAASGQVPPFEIQRLNRGGSLYLTRPTLAHHIADREELLMRGRDVLGAIEDGTLTIAIGARYALEDAVEAYDALESRRTTGKLLLIP